MTMTAGAGATPPLLCITVPTIPGRESLLSRCLWSITTQWVPGVQVLVVPGVGLLGDKCNAAARHTQARYMTVVDDDDYLAADYLHHILPALDVDFVGLRVVQVIDGKFFRMSSTRGDRAGFAKIGANHGPTPKGVTRTELWRQVPYGNKYESDREWSARVSPLIETHRFVDRALYLYDHHSTGSGWGGSPDVGTWPFDPAVVDVL